MKYKKSCMCIFFYQIYFRESFVLCRHLKPCYYRYLNVILSCHYFIYPYIDMPFEKKTGFFQQNCQAFELNFEKNPKKTP